MLVRGKTAPIGNPYDVDSSFSDSNLLTLEEKRTISGGVEMLSRKLSGKSLAYGETTKDYKP